jgi:hypothetical protein
MAGDELPDARRETALADLPDLQPEAAQDAPDAHNASVLWWPALLAIAPDLIGFGQAKMAKRALVLTFGGAALVASTGASLPAAMVCPELSLFGIGRDVFKKPVPALTTAHDGSAKKLHHPNPKFYGLRQKAADIRDDLRQSVASSQGTKKCESWN